jgi:TolB-like protein/class 3 adenylate cyclase/Flp pilus assembly protein TadD
MTEPLLQPRHERRLAAVMVVDLAGGSAGADREAAETAARIGASRLSAIAGEIARRRGRVVNQSGAGCILAFSSASDAADCALAIRAALGGGNGGAVEAPALRVRIGINLGELVDVMADQVEGDGATLAIWLESIAPPDGIMISAAVQEQIVGRGPYRFVDLGYRRPPRVDRLIRVYRLCRPEEEGDRGWALSGVVAAVEQPRLSILALPFRTPGGSSEDEYFAEGLTEDVITDLSRIPGSFVIARNTAFAYKGKPVDVTAVGRELNVRYVLQGSVRRASRKVRVSAKLIDAMTEANVWLGRFDSNERDLLALQDELTGRIASALDYQLTDAEARRTAPDRPDDLDAVDLTMRGWSFVNKPTTWDNLKTARRLFEAALAREPDYAHALVGLAETYVYDVGLGYGADAPAQLALAEAAILRALALDPRHARGHNVRAIQLRWSLQFAEALIALEQALELNPNLASAHAQIGLTKLLIDRPDEAFGHVEKALRLSPRDFNLGAWLAVIGAAHLLLKQDEQAIDVLRRAVSANTSLPHNYALLAAAYALSGRIEAARSALVVLDRLLPHMTVKRSLERWVPAPDRLRRFGRLVKGLELAGMPLE